MKRPRDALCRHRYRVQHDARARCRARRRAVEEGDGAAGVHADQQGARRRWGDPRREGRRSLRGRRDPGPAGERARGRRDPRGRDGGGARGIQQRRGRRCDRRRRRRPGRGAERRGGGEALLHRRDQDARPPGRGQGRRRRRRRRLDRGDPRHRAGRRRGGPLLAGRLGRPRQRADLLRSAFRGRDPQGPRPHRRHLRGGRDRAPGPGRRGRRQRHLAAPVGRRGARVRDPGAGDPRALRRPGRRRRASLRARPRTGPHPHHRRAAAGEGLRAARPAAADRQGRPARGRRPRPAQRQHQRLQAPPRRLASTAVL